MLPGICPTVIDFDIYTIQVRIWRDGEEIKVATDYDAKKETDLVVNGLRPDIVYKLRVFGYSRGGQGAQSSPALKFMLGKNCLIHSFIHSGDLYSASSRDCYSEALPVQPRTKKKDLREM